MENHTLEQRDEIVKIHSKNSDFAKTVRSASMHIFYALYRPVIL